VLLRAGGRCGGKESDQQAPQCAHDHFTDRAYSSPRSGVMS
jgi:hypothetical protein